MHSHRRKGIHEILPPSSPYSAALSGASLTDKNENIHQSPKVLSAGLVRASSVFIIDIAPKKCLFSVCVCVSLMDVSFLFVCFLVLSLRIGNVTQMH